MNTTSSMAMTALFLQQSLMDSMDDYNRALAPASSIPTWDCVVITASNESQAAGYRKQIAYRQSHGRLPSRTEFLVVPDREGKRVGSAGSTLSVIRLLKERYGGFDNRRILVLHAGGNSSRTPQYSALGKLFSPLPTALYDTPATLFDMFMVSMASIPGRLREGMLLLSGDVVLLFNPLMCDFSDAAVISFKERVETAQNHGVYIKGASGNVKRFLHKQPVERLQAEGAVDARGNCDIDTGAIELSPAILEKLYTLVDTETRYDAFVNDRVRLSLYGDIAYCLAEESTLEDFLKEQPEGEFCDELTAARTQLWNAISSYNMKLLSVSPSKFVHFGSIPEIMNLMAQGVKAYESLGWKKQINSSIRREDVAGYNAVLADGVTVGEGCYLEVSYVHRQARLGDHVYLSFVDVEDEEIPDHVLLHGLKQRNGKFVCRIMGTEDNPKSTRLFGKELETLGLDDLWEPGDKHTLWNAKLYPECNSIREAVRAARALYDLVMGSGDAAAWRAASRKSLCEGFQDADPQAILDWNTRMEELVRMDELGKAIAEGRSVREIAAQFPFDHLTKIQKQWLENQLKKCDTTTLPDFSYAMRLYYYLGVLLDDETYMNKCFRLIADTVLDGTMKHVQYREDCHICEEETVVRLPLRVNWGGGWTDTCPHCIERGGVVLNTAIRLNGELPVEIRLVRIPEHKIVFDSRDMDVHGEFFRVDELQKTGDPYDPFALQKACLLACGVIPKEGGDLEQILTRLGGGFEMHSEVTNVPKGSGLGTSSILSAAAVKAVGQFMGMAYTQEALYSTVLAMEQIMSTGGGWQDQVGGLTPGIKFISSFPGIDQKLRVEPVTISDETKKELSDRFAVIYTGQRRLARNLLRDVVGRYVGNEPDSLTAHKEIQKLAALMRFSLERGDVDAFAELLDEHWKWSRMIDKGSTNTLIDQIFLSIDDLIDARMVCGAGGGGFLQVILKKGVTKTAVHERLKEVFQDFAVDVWPSEIVYGDEE